MLLSRAAEPYLLSQRQAGASLATLQQYGWHVGKMVAWLADEGAVYLGEVGRDDLRAWGAGLRDRWSPATVKQAVCAARSFFRWCHSEGLLADNPALVLRVPRVPARVQRTLSAAEVSALLAGCDGGVKGRRDAALVALLVDAGLRNAEICRLAVVDLCLERRQLVVQIKGGDQAVGYFGAGCAGRLAAWLEVRCAASGVATVFCSCGGNTPGQSLTGRGLRLVLKRLGERVGVAGVCPHALRRSFATLMLLNGAPSRIVQACGRWGDLEMVERYSLALDPSSVYREFSPLDRLVEP